MPSPLPPEAALQDILGGALEALELATATPVDALSRREVGRVLAVAHGIATIEGLPGARAEELVSFPGGGLGVVMQLDPDEVGVILLDDAPEVGAGAEVRRTGRMLEVPAGPALLGRVLDPTGRPLDGLGRLPAEERMPVEREAPGLHQRSPVRVPLQTGLSVIDALVPVGRGQRELILGDRQTGKTSLALDAVRNQQDVVSVWCAVGQSASGVASVIQELRASGAMPRTVVVVAGADDPAGLQYLAPYAATAMAEWFRDRGRDALVVYDDLTRHARAYRELSLLLRRPPGREAYPGDVFYLHSRLLERSTRLAPEHGGGSLTALPLAETEAGNIADYIPTNLISITDGQVVLSSDLFQRGFLPAVDVGLSVSRVGGDAQLPAYRSVSSDLRVACARFAELEVFSRFSSRLDDSTRAALTRGRRVREVLKQGRADPRTVASQIAVLVAATSGGLDGVPMERVTEAEKGIRAALAREMPDLERRVAAREPLSEQDLETLRGIAGRVVASLEEPGPQTPAARGNQGERGELAPTDVEEPCAPRPS